MLLSHTCAHQHACGSSQTRLVSGAKCVESLASVKQTADGDASSAEDDQERDHEALPGTSASKCELGQRWRQKKDRK